MARVKTLGSVPIRGPALHPREVQVRILPGCEEAGADHLSQDPNTATSRLCAPSSAYFPGPPFPTGQVLQTEPCGEDEVKQCGWSAAF